MGFETPVQAATGELAHLLCTAIALCKDLQRVVSLLQCASEWLLDLQPEISNLLEFDDQGDIQEAQKRLLAAAQGTSQAAVRAAFYDSCFPEMAEVLFSVVAPDWLPRLDTPQQHQLFRRWFDEAPAAPLLRALSWHLSSVEPSYSIHPGSRQGMVLPMSAEITAELLAQRFAGPFSRGVADIAAEKRSNAEELAALLAGVPDLVAALPDAPEALHPTSFAPTVVLRLLECVQDDRAALPMATDVASRFAQRGFAQLVAQALLKNESSYTTAGAVLAGCPSTPALEKLLEAVMVALPRKTTEPSSSPPEDSPEQKGTLQLLRLLLPPSTWFSRSDARFVLQEKLVTQRVLPARSLSLLLRYLDAHAEGKDSEDALAGAALRVAAVWGDRSALRRLPPPQQAYMTAALADSLSLLGKDRFERCDGLMPAVLRGISARLESPQAWVRRQGMAVGHAMSQTLQPGCDPLFGDQDLAMLPEERWEVAEGAGKEKEMEEERQQEKAAARKERKSRLRIEKKMGNKKVRAGDEFGPLTETDSDDEVVERSGGGQGSSSDSEFERFDLEESDEEDPSRTNLQLRDLVSMLQKADTDWKGQLQALKSAEALVRSAPDELAHYAVPLARALLLTRVPRWSEEERAAGDDLPAEDRRFRSLVALTAAAPEPVGLALAGEVYSPSLDMQQRARALEVLASAAKEIASPGSVLGALEVGSSGGQQQRLADSQRGAQSGANVGRVVRASTRSLEKQRQQELQQQKQQRGLGRANRFPPVALQWAAALLRECDVRRHGVDLFGRDHVILGRLLATLGSFLEAAQRSPQAAPLAAAVVELVKGSRVHDNEEPYVRRAALAAAAHALMAVPPAAVASSLLVGAGTGDHAPVAALVERLEWVRGWVADVAESDPDANCRALADGCRQLQGALSNEAMAALTQGSGGERGGIRGGRQDFSLGGGAPQFSVAVPKIEALRLG